MAQQPWGTIMANGLRHSLLENVLVLVLLGILAGAVAGLGIGMVQTRATSSTVGK